jgi:hypothetical protein
MSVDAMPDPVAASAPTEPARIRELTSQLSNFSEVTPNGK